MRYGFNVPNRGPFATPGALTTLGRRGEELGYYCIFTGDHILVPRSIDSPYPYTAGGEFPGSPTGESMEQLILLTYLAAKTERIRLVTGVLIVPHRNPLVAAKALATMDVLSGGRLVVGIGVGWMREEFEALGLPPFEERGAVTDEYITAFKELWTSDNPTFEGRYCRFFNISFEPKPLQKPHPPFWVGGESRPALRRTGELADGWYPIGSNPQFPMGTPELLKQGMERVATYARRAGRDPAQIEVIYRSPQYELRKDGRGPGGERELFTGVPEQIAADIRIYEALGVKQLTFDIVRQSRTLDEALENLEELASLVWPLV